MKIAQVGDYSVSNWGDQLYPGASRHLFRELGVDVSPSYFAPLAGTTASGEPISPYSEVGRSGAAAVLVGGGDLIRFDTLTVALDHMSVPHERRRGRLLKWRAESFARRHLADGPGAWMPTLPWIPGAPTALVSVGIHTPPPTSEVARAFSQVKAAWARTASGAEQLRTAGVDPDNIVLAPDMIFGLAELMQPEAARTRGAALLSERLGVDEPVAIFHAATFHGWPPARVESALVALRGIPTAVLSLGAYSGEDRVLADAARAVGVGALIGHDPDEITAVLAAAGAVFTTSMHAAIVAGSFGTPVFVPGVKKTSEAFAACPSPPPVEGVDEADLAGALRARLGSRTHHDPRPNAHAATAAMLSVLQRLGIA